MTTYEILTIASPQADEKAQRNLIKKIQDLISQEKGKAISEEHLGTKKLATPIEKQETGTYLSIVAELKPDKIKDIQKSLKSSGEIIKVFIFKIAEPQKDLPAGKAGKPKPKAKKLSARLPARQEAKSAEALRVGGKITKPKKIEKVSGIKLEKIKPKLKLKKEPVKPEKKSEITTEIEGEEDRLKKLDEKLDELLKE
jgi:ribosomal protein S6